LGLLGGGEGGGPEHRADYANRCEVAQGKPPYSPMAARDASAVEAERADAFISCYYDLEKITGLG
jgi:hypothetical protein